MNLLGIALVWCVVQVTLMAAAAAGIYLVLRRFRPAAAGPVVLTGLAVVVMLSLFAVSPWPRWNWGAVASNAESPASQARTEEGQKGGAAAGPSAASASPADALAVKTPSQPSNAALFWKALREELARPDRNSSGAAWRWPAVLAAVLLAAMASGLAWLGLGIVAVRWQRRHSRAVQDTALLELIAMLREELGCKRPVEARECDDLTTAATIGWRRPTVLLPLDWRSWSVAERRAILAHEIAHARGHDYPALICGQLGVMLHFYHPFVHWLMNRLRLEQELAADAAAASVSGGQRQYLKTIAELALRRQDRPLRWPVRCFLPSRSTFLRRIAMLRDSKLPIERRSAVGRVVAVGAVVVCGLLVAGLRGQSGPEAALADDGTIAKTATVAALAQADDHLDKTFIPAMARALVVIRPAAALKNPAVAPWADIFAHSGNGVPRGVHLAEVRQITCILGGYEIPQGPRETVIFQFAEPVDFSLFSKGMEEIHREGPEYAGKKLFVRITPATEIPAPLKYGGYDDIARETVVQYDDRTIIRAGSEKVMTAYLRDKRGALPAWIPAEKWKAFADDHVLLAGDMSEVRLTVKAAMEHGPREASMMMTMFSPLWESSKNGMAGLRIGDELQIHGVMEGDDETAAERIEKTAESLRVLGLNAIDALQQKAPPDEGRALLGLLKSGLKEMKVVRAGATVEAKAAVSLATMEKLRPMIDVARQSARRMRSSNNLRQLALAMLAYEAAHKEFPPAVRIGPDGKTPHSWRVALLPYMEQKALYDQYHFDEPWDSTANRKVLDQMPAVYRSPTDAEDSKNSSYFVLTGPATIFEGEKGAKISTVVDGLSHTILLVETKRDIPWTKPEDIPYDADKPMPDLHGYYDGKYLFALADGSVHFFAKDLAEKTLRLMIGKADREPVETPPEAR